LRTLAVGDIHGCLDLFDHLLDFVEYDHGKDRLIVLGDYIDRGPDSAGVIDRMIDLGKGDHVVALRGNHEVMMQSARTDSEAGQMWMSYGGEETLRSYLPAEQAVRLKDLTRVPPEHWHFLNKTCVPFWETGDHLFVHAGMNPQVAPDHQDDHEYYWTRFRNWGPHQSGKRLICGHTAQKSGLPQDVGHSVCIDTWAWGEGWLTCLDVGTDQFWQTNRHGNRRRGTLAEI